MKADELANIKKLIAESPVLSIIERAEWNQLVYEMDDQQLAELSSILQQTKSAAVAAMPSNALRPANNNNVQSFGVSNRVSAPATLPGKQQYSAPQRQPKEIKIGQVNINQKELPPGIPFDEKELNAPNAAARPVAKPPVNVQQQRPAPTAPPPAVPMPQQPRSQPAVQAAEPVPLEPEPQPMPENVSAPTDIILKTPDDFLGLTPAILHHQDPLVVLKKLYAAISDVAAASSNYLPIIYNLEQSPLYKTYVNVGVALLNDPTKSRDNVYGRLIEEANMRNEDYMNKEEFEAFTDFRRELDKLLV